MFYLEHACKKIGQSEYQNLTKLKPKDMGNWGSILILKMVHRIYYLSIGTSAIARGWSMSSQKRTLRNLPSSVATSILLVSPSVQ